MAIMTQDELLSTLDSKQYDEILGTPECAWLDFKESAYSTEKGKPRKLSIYGKSELCKDVTSFANHIGGVLLLGVSEALSPTSGASVADAIRPLSVSSIDLAHYKQVMRDLIFPLIEGIEMKWYPTEPGQGILAIIIPKNSIELHIPRHIYDEDGKKIRGLEIPVRADDHTFLHTAESLSRLINKQRQITENTNPTKPKKSDLHQQIPHEVIERVRSQQAESKQIAERASESIRSQVIEMKDWSESPTLTLQVIPLNGKDRLDNFYDKIKRSFADTTPTRNIGFNLNSIGYESDTLDGAFIKTGVRDGAIRLDPNGTFTLCLAASPDFLGWAVNRETFDRDTTKLNSIVLVEVIFEFTKFVEEVLRPAGLINWEYCLEIRNFKTHSISLYSGPPGGFHDDLSKASKDTYLKILGKNRDHPHATFAILTEVYAFFTLPESSIPYTDNKQVTKEAILSINANGR